MKTLVAVSSLFLLVNLVGCGASAPGQGDGERAAVAEISKESAGCAKLVSFRKTNGQEQEDRGIKLYRMEYTCEIEFTRDSSWEVGCFHAIEAGQGPSPQYRPVEAGQRVPVTGYVIFEKTENGWRSTDRRD